MGVAGEPVNTMQSVDTVFSHTFPSVVDDLGSAAVKAKLRIIAIHDQCPELIFYPRQDTQIVTPDCHPEMAYCGPGAKSKQKKTQYYFHGRASSSPTAALDRLASISVGRIQPIADAQVLSAEASLPNFNSRARTRLRKAIAGACDNQTTPTANAMKAYKDMSPSM